MLADTDQPFGASSQKPQTANRKISRKRASNRDHADAPSTNSGRKSGPRLRSELGHNQAHALQKLFDHFVGAGKQRGRHNDTECLRRFEIHDQFKSRGLPTGRSLGGVSFKILST